VVFLIGSEKMGRRGPDIHGSMHIYFILIFLKHTFKELIRLINIERDDEKKKYFVALKRIKKKKKIKV